MFKMYFVTAWRSLLKDKMYSLINVFGLSVGIAIAILIGLWLYEEISFNKSFDNYPRIAQVVQNVSNNGEVATWKTVPYPLAEELRKNYGGDFKRIAMGSNWVNHSIAIGEKKLELSGAYFENEFPDIFSLPMLQGKRDALNDATSVLISENPAKTCFGAIFPIGKLIVVDKQEPLKVAGVYKDFQNNSTFRELDFIAPWSFFARRNDNFRGMTDPWRPNFTTLFVELNANADFACV